MSVITLNQVCSVVIPLLLIIYFSGCYCQLAQKQRPIVKEETTTPKLYEDRLIIKKVYKDVNGSNSSLIGHQAFGSLSFGAPYLQRKEQQKPLDKVKSVNLGDKTMEQMNDEDDDDDDDDGGEYDGCSSDNAGKKKELHNAGLIKQKDSMPMMFIRQLDLLAVEIPMKNQKNNEWSEWSPCSQSCGDGVQTRARPKGTGCQDQEHQVRSCHSDCSNMQPADSTNLNNKFDQSFRTRNNKKTDNFAFGVDKNKDASFDFGEVGNKNWNFGYKSGIIEDHKLKPDNGYDSSGIRDIRYDSDKSFKSDFANRAYIPDEGIQSIKFPSCGLEASDEKDQKFDSGNRFQSNEVRDFRLNPIHFNGDQSNFKFNPNFDDRRMKDLQFGMNGNMYIKDQNSASKLGDMRLAHALDVDGNKDGAGSNKDFPNYVGDYN